MSSEPRVYVSVERPGRQLIIDGDLRLFALLLQALQNGEPVRRTGRKAQRPTPRGNAQQQPGESSHV